MIIVNGKTRSLVVFGDVTQDEFLRFMASMQAAVKKHEDEGRPQSGSLA